jgi:transketolase
LHPLAEKFRAFRWAVQEVDGHDHNAIREAFETAPWIPGRPSCLIANTVKGRGVEFMEGELKWHYSSPNDEQLMSALTHLQEH